MLQLQIVSKSVPVPRYLSVFIAPPEGAAAHTQQSLSHLALWHQRYTPLAAADAPDGIMLDVAGAAHLFGGEKNLMPRIEADLQSRGLAARTGLADTPEAAWALARFGEETRRYIPAGTEEKLVARVMGNLPMAALRLETETTIALSQTGLKRIGDIILRPRAPLTARFGKLLFARLDAMLGRTKSAISPQFEAPAYIAERRFADGIAMREAIEATIAALTHDLCAMLEKHGEGARRLMAVLFRADGRLMHVECATSRPQRDVAILTRLFHEKIDAAAQANQHDPLDAGFGFDVIRLAVMAAEPLRERQREMHGAMHAPDCAGQMQVQQQQDDRPNEDLAQFLDRMSARFGAHRVLRFAANDTHMPEHAATPLPAIQCRAPESLLAAHVQAGGESAAAPGYSIARPIRLFERPEAVEAIATVPDGPPLRFRWRRALHEVVAYEGPERIAPQWWKQEAQALTRDYFRVEDTQGRRFWLYREGLYARETQRPRWFMHGVFG
ncbi:MAG: DNA polymerase Y family protein [Beijerinckiaceae bacterium]